jgi:hypothetical protein
VDELVYGPIVPGEVARLGQLHIRVNHIEPHNHTHLVNSRLAITWSRVLLLCHHQTCISHLLYRLGSGGFIRQSRPSQAHAYLASPILRLASNLGTYLLDCSSRAASYIPRGLLLFLISYGGTWIYSSRASVAKSCRSPSSLNRTDST